MVSFASAERCSAGRRMINIVHIARSGASVGGVFINYRGADSDTAAALIDRELATWFGSDHVFLDCRSILAGADYVEELLERLRASSVLLVVIGRHWLTLTDDAGNRRIDDPKDWVRREIAEAFRYRLRVIPVLLDRVAMPGPADLPNDIARLSRRQYVPLRRRYTETDLTFLAKRIIEADPELAKIAARRRSGASSEYSRTPTAPATPRSIVPHLLVGRWDGGSQGSTAGGMYRFTTEGDVEYSNSRTGVHKVGTVDVKSDHMRFYFPNETPETVRWRTETFDLDGYHYTNLMLDGFSYVRQDAEPG